MLNVGKTLIMFILKKPELGKVFGENMFPTNIASVNLVMSRNKFFFPTIVTPALAF